MNLRLAQAPFSSLQGEGMYSGVASTFVRLQGCNLRCQQESREGLLRYFTCDTLDARKETGLCTEEVDVDTLADTVDGMTARHVVVTGGEPMLQAEELQAFLAQLWHLRTSARETPKLITLETNGTIYHQGVMEWLHLVSLSPKLQFMNGVTKMSLRSWLMAACSTDTQVQMKIVCASLPDYAEAVQLFCWASELAAVACIVQPAWPMTADFQDVVREVTESPAPGLEIRLCAQAHKVFHIR